MQALFQAGRIGLKNRLVMPAMTTRLAEPDGSVSQTQIAYIADALEAALNVG